MSITTEQVLQALSAVNDPELGRDVVTLGMIKDLTVKDGKVRFTLELTTPACPVKDEFKASCQQAVTALAGVESVEVQLSARQRATRPALGSELAREVKNILAVASGKGGVGKSTVASNLACALAAEGARVGLLDLDVYGPSIPALLGLKHGELTYFEETQLVAPMEKFGMKIMSMGFLVPPGQSVIWRGPMLHGQVDFFFRKVHWGELDYLVVDLPPGTGDVQLSLSQLVPLGGAVVVSTPQDVALGVATKAINMFEKLKVPVLGLVENMSFYSCPHCHQRDDVFGHGGARETATRLGVAFLGEIPLNSQVRQAGDEGTPVVVAQPDSAAAQAFRACARLTAGRLSVAAVEGTEALKSNLIPVP